MKFSPIIAPAFFLLSEISADWIGRHQGRAHIKKAVHLDTKSPVEIHFDDLPSFLGITGEDPLGTFVFYVISPKQKHKQIVLINVKGLREIHPDIILSISGCQYPGKSCVPNIINVTPRPFDKDSLKDRNVAYLDTSKFKANKPFYIYLQVGYKLGIDNPITQAYPPIDPPGFQEITHPAPDKTTKTALTLFICYKNRGC